MNLFLLFIQRIMCFRFLLLSLLFPGAIRMILISAFGRPLLLVVWNLKFISMKNLDFFTALLHVPGSYQVPVSPEDGLDRYLVEYTWCLNCEQSGLIVISVFKHSRYLYDVSLRCTNRFVEVLEICYPTSALSYLMQFRPDELRKSVPFLIGKFKTYELFLCSFYRSIRVLDLEFFDHFIGF